MARELPNTEELTTRGQFAESARVRAVPAQQSHNVTPQIGVTATAHEEIDNRVAMDRQMRRHDDLWRRERNKIATASDPYPDFDLGSRSHRNIQSEYKERRFVWEQKQDEIEGRFAAQREDIRARGQTLGNEFAAHNTPGLKTATPAQTDAGAPGRNNDKPAPSPGHEFQAHAPAPNRGKHR